MAERRPRKKQGSQAKQRGATGARGSAAARSGAKAAAGRPRRTTRKAPGAPARRARAVPAPEPVIESLEALEAREALPGVGPVLSGGDLDADWPRAEGTGEEAVGGSVATPDQDVVDEIGRALGVEQPPEGEVWTSQEILGARDRHYWHLERKAAEEEEEA